MGDTLYILSSDSEMEDGILLLSGGGNYRLNTPYPPKDSVMINGVACDTFAYIDEKRTRDTIVWPAEGRETYDLTAYLFADGKPFPLRHSNTDVECYITEGRNDPDAEVYEIAAHIGADGEVIIPIASRYRIPGKLYYCEINVIGAQGEEDESRFKAANFRLAISS